MRALAGKRSVARFRMQGSNSQTAPSQPFRAIEGPSVGDEQHWSRCKLELATRIPAPFFRTFIAPIESDSRVSDDGQLRLFVPTDKLKKHIQSRYFALIEETLGALRFQGQVSLVTGVSPRAALQLASGPPPLLAPPNGQSSEDAGNRTGPSAQSRALTTATPNSAARRGPSKIRHPRDTSWGSVAQFYPNAANEAAVALLLSGGRPEEVVVVTGPAGSGKSTLGMMAARTARERGGSARYLPLEVFLTEFSLACRERNVIDWRGELRSHSLLVIDDLQFMKKTAHKSQEELRHLIDDLERTGSRLILLSDAPLRRLPLAPDLQSRLYLAGNLPLLYPDETARLRILTDAVDLALRLQSLPPGHKPPGARLLSFAAAGLSGDGRRLVSAARKLALLGDGDLDSARRALADLFEETSRPKSPARVIALVAENMQVSAAAICGPARDKRYALARHLVAYLCTETLGMKLAETATVVGRREHGSVIHARRRIAALMERDLFFRDQVSNLADRLLNPA